MSGRLVILPHKSWNVWNRDNQEKVLRDERLHREEEEAKRIAEEKLLQEKNLESLTRSTAAAAAEEEISVKFEPFRLFEDLEQKHFEALGNEDYIKERADEERKKQKRDGTLAWSLGEQGSHVPWYAKVKQENGADSKEQEKDVARVVNRLLGKPFSTSCGEGSSSSSSSSKLPVDELKAREIKRKQLADPMNGLLLHSSTATTAVITNSYEMNSINESKQSDNLVGNIDQDRCSDDSRSITTSGSSEGGSTNRVGVERVRCSSSKRHSHRRKEREAKKEERKEEKKKRSRSEGRDKIDTRDRKHKHRHKRESSERRHRSDNIGIDETSASSRAVASTSKKQQQISAAEISLQELRRRRIEREATEKKRVAVLLAEADIYGVARMGQTNDPGGYNQQFHPQLARKYHYRK